MKDLCSAGICDCFRVKRKLMTRRDGESCRKGLGCLTCESHSLITIEVWNCF